MAPDTKTDQAMILQIFPVVNPRLDKDGFKAEMINNKFFISPQERKDQSMMVMEPEGQPVADSLVHSNDPIYRREKDTPTHSFTA